MTKSILMGILFSITLGSIHAQTFDYKQLGVLFSQEPNVGTARFKGLGGAFGALGGDLSAMEINPAGGAVFTTDELGFSISYNTNDMLSTYYGNSLMNTNYKTNFEQAGYVSVLRDIGFGDDINQIFFAFNYTKNQDFDRFWKAEGNSGVSTWVEDPIYDDVFYTQGDYQYYESYTQGWRNSYSFFMGGKFLNFLNLGFGTKAHDLNFYQEGYLEEGNSSPEGFYNDSFIDQWQQIWGTGISFNLGMILKPTNSIRIGMSYESPIWWEMQEQSNLFKEGPNDIPGYYEIEYSTDPGAYYSNNKFKLQEYFYQMQTPGKFTLSSAIVLGRVGFISADYSRKFYSNLKFNTYGFNEENIDLQRNLWNTNELRIGAELRLSVIRLRGGYQFVDSPWRYTPEIMDTYRNYTFGAGLDFGRVKIDVAYQMTEQNSEFSFYPDFPTTINPASIRNDASNWTTSFLIRL